MLTKTETANLTLGKLGHSHVIANIETDVTTVGKILRRQFPTAFNSILSHHRWSFATEFKPLNLVQENPSPVWGYAYAAPADTHMLRRIEPQNFFIHENLYRKMQNKWIEVYTDAGLVYYSNVPFAWAEITRAIDPLGPWPEHFARATACQWALDSAPSLITNNFARIRASLTSELRNEITQQIALDLSNNPEPDDAESPFLAARREH